MPVLPGSNVDRLRRIQAEKRRVTSAAMGRALNPRLPIDERRAALSQAMGGLLHRHPGQPAHRHPGGDDGYHTHSTPKG
jgi:hypothetical protein